MDILNFKSITDKTIHATTFQDIHRSFWSSEKSFQNHPKKSHLKYQLFCHPTGRKWAKYLCSFKKCFEQKVTFPAVWESIKVPCSQKRTGFSSMLLSLHLLYTCDKSSSKVSFTKAFEGSSDHRHDIRKTGKPEANSKERNLSHCILKNWSSFSTQAYP